MPKIEFEYLFPSVNIFSALCFLSLFITTLDILVIDRGSEEQTLSHISNILKGRQLHIKYNKFNFELVMLLLGIFLFIATLVILFNKNISSTYYITAVKILIHDISNYVSEKMFSGPSPISHPELILLYPAIALIADALPKLIREPTEGSIVFSQEGVRIPTYSKKNTEYYIPYDGGAEINIEEKPILGISKIIIKRKNIENIEIYGRYIYNSNEYTVSNLLKYLFTASIIDEHSIRKDLQQISEMEKKVQSELAYKKSVIEIHEHYKTIVTQIVLAETIARAKNSIEHIKKIHGMINMLTEEIKKSSLSETEKKEMLQKLENYTN